MSVKHFMMHRLQKVDAESPCEVDPRKEELSTEHYVHSILSEFKRILGARAGRQHGQFALPDESNQAGFCPLTQRWRRGDLPFIDYSLMISKQLADALNQHELPFIGYLCFICEQLERGERLFIFHLRQASALMLDQQLEFRETSYIEFSETGFGVCLDLQAFESQQSPYITLSFGRGDRGSKAAIESWLGYCESVDKKEETRVFLQAVDQYCEHLEADSSQPLKDKVIEYCLEQDKSGEAVEYQQLGQWVDPQLEGYLRDHLNQAALLPDRSTLRSYVRLSAKHQDYSLSFASAALGSSVHFDAERETLTFSQLPARFVTKIKSVPT